MLFKIDTVNSKTPDWKLVTAHGVDGSVVTEASVNRVDKQGKTWDKFDEIVEGGTVEADLWKSPTNKQYLFAPKPRATGNSGAMKGVAAAQERKAESISKTMDRKEAGIMISAAMRDATAIALAAAVPFPTDEEFIAEFTKWRDWYLAKWRETEKIVDTPF